MPKMNIELTKMSQKGQVVIPLDVRESLHLMAGTRFAVYGMDDTVMLKKITPPTIEDFEGLAQRMSAAAKERGITRDDINDAIKDARLKK